MAGHEENNEPTEREEPEERGRRATPKAIWMIAIGIALVVLTLLAALLWLNRPEVDETSVVTVQGVEYVTNVTVEEQDGYVYVLMPVNSDAASVVLEVADDRDNAKIREFLDGLDTLVPGEHVLSLSDANLHFILDGIE